MISRVLSFIMKSALSGAALGAGAGIARKLNFIPSVDSKKETTIPNSSTKQTKFKINSGYSDYNESRPWIEAFINNEQSIERMIISFAKEVYSGLNGFESKMTSSPAFQSVKDSVVFSNRTASGDNVVILPAMFKSKKQLVDYFIDDVAK